MDLLPACNRKAKVLSEVYKMNKILNEEELKALKDEITFAISDPDIWSTNRYSPFFIFCCEKARETEENILERLCLIQFAELLIQFLKTSTKRLASEKVVFCSFSPVIHSKILNEFCNKTETNITRPLSMRDKCLCYIITVTLLACNYEINLKLLAMVTFVHLNKLSRLARIVGAVPASTEENTFVPKLPLAALPNPFKRKLRRR